VELLAQVPPPWLAVSVQLTTQLEAWQLVSVEEPSHWVVGAVGQVTLCAEPQVEGELTEAEGQALMAAAA
jgi:hypothetical protein